MLSDNYFNAEGMLAFRNVEWVSHVGRVETVISLKILQLWMAGIEFGFFEANE